MQSVVIFALCHQQRTQTLIPCARTYNKQWQVGKAQEKALKGRKKTTNKAEKHVRISEMPL